MDTDNVCYFCARWDSGSFSRSPDPDHPAFPVCTRKTCARQRSETDPAARLAKYQQHQERYEAARAIKEKERLEEKRRSAVQVRAWALRVERVNEYGSEAVLFAEKLADGWVCPCRDHRVEAAGKAALRDAAIVSALTETEIIRITRAQGFEKLAHELKLARRWAALNAEAVRLAKIDAQPYLPFGSYLGKMSARHAEVRRNVAAAHKLVWVEADLPDYGGIQSWFTGQEGSHPHLSATTRDVVQQIEVLTAVVAADLQPIPAKECAACGKDAGLEYTEYQHKRSWRRSRHDPILALCTNPQCLAKRDREERNGVDLNRFLSQRQVVARNRKTKLTPHDAPGVLPESTTFNEADNILKIAEWEAQLAFLNSEHKGGDWFSRDELNAKKALYKGYAVQLQGWIDRAKVLMG